jgi:hypothetical protein
VKSLSLIFLVGAAVFSTGVAKPPQTPGEPPEVAAPVGRLGYPIGTYLTIEGVRAERGKVGTQSLLVDKIGDFNIDPPVGIWIKNLQLPQGVRCVLKGYESGGWIGTPDPVLQATGAPLPQAVWQFHFYFLATSVVEPASLKLKQP